MRTSQELIHWLEQGGGARWLRWAVLVVACLLLTVVYSWKQFHGVPNEFVAQQTVLGRQIARGDGFSTLVNYPQTYSVLAKQNHGFDVRTTYPELHHAPLYALVLAPVFAVIPDAWWNASLVPPNGYRPDYVVLGLNLALFWIAVGLVWRLGRKLFDERVAWVAAVATAVSVAFWEQTVMLTGLPLFMVLALALFVSLTGVETRLSEATRFDFALGARLALIGVWCAALALTEYSAGLVVLVVTGFLAWQASFRLRAATVGVVLATFVLCVSPWLVRNISVVGHPLGLAWQNLALKAGDTTAEPSTRRTLATAEAPGLEMNKLGNKGLTGLEENLKARIWSGGGMFLTAFFVAGLAYQFRNRSVNRVRWCFAAVLLVMLIGQPFLNSGESPRLPAFYLAPLVILFGAGFFFVLMDSQQQLTLHWRWVAAGLLVLQALPLVRDCMEPRKIHFHFPPYFPSLFIELKRDMQNRFVPDTGVSTDVPAGTAWYGQMRVWAKPDQLSDLRRIMVEQPIGAMLLTPETLDRPFFTQLGSRPGSTISVRDAGGWGTVYAGLVTGRLPTDFPLNRPPQRLTENMVLLVNPYLVR